jgi:hypothetical protein
MIKQLCWISVGVMFSALPVAAQSESAFRTPSGNIHCILTNDSLRCDVKDNQATLPKRPKNCGNNANWGSAFQMSSQGRAERICHGDTAVNDDRTILNYGDTWKQGSYTCISMATGLTCRNKDKRGWELSAKQQRIF